MKHEAWAVWVKWGKMRRWFCCDFTVSVTRRGAVAKYDQGSGYWDRDRKRGIAKCVRTTLTAGGDHE